MPPRPKCLDDNYDRYKRSKGHEDRLAKELGGKRLPRSGGLAWSKGDPTTAGGDLATGSLHIEHKRTVNESISVKKEWLHKVSDGARRVGKYPGLLLTFETKMSPPEDWICLPLDMVKKYIPID